MLLFVICLLLAAFVALAILSNSANVHSRMAKGQAVAPALRAVAHPIVAVMVGMGVSMALLLLGATHGLGTGLA